MYSIKVTIEMSGDYPECDYLHSIKHITNLSQKEAKLCVEGIEGYINLLKTDPLKKGDR